jgi:hypothetical protein
MDSGKGGAYIFEHSFKYDGRGTSVSGHVGKQGRSTCA